MLCLVGKLSVHCLFFVSIGRVVSHVCMSMLPLTLWFPNGCKHEQEGEEEREKEKKMQQQQQQQQQCSNLYRIQKDTWRKRNPNRYLYKTAYQPSKMHILGIT